MRKKTEAAMANFHPALYRWLLDHYREYPEQAKCLADLLTMCSLIEGEAYPVNAKYALQQMGIPMTLTTRKIRKEEFSYIREQETLQLLELSEWAAEHICVKN